MKPVIRLSKRESGDFCNAIFFIGLGSGLSWLAWAIEKPVVLISGFSETWAEFHSLCYRVINKGVCHSCWNDTSVDFDRGDWNWCPRHKGTDREFECSKRITDGMVREAIFDLQSYKRPST